MGRRKARQKRIRCVPKASRYCAFGSWSWTKLQGITVHRLLSARSHCAKKETLTSYTRGKIASRHIFSFSAVCARSSTAPVTSRTTETERRELARGVRAVYSWFLLEREKNCAHTHRERRERRDFAAVCRSFATRYARK